MNVFRTALLLASIGVGASAQTALLDNFNNPGATGSVITISSWALSANNILRNAGTITVTGSARDDNGWGATGVSIDGSSMTHVTVRAQRDADNVASSLVVGLVSSNLVEHTLSVPTSSFQVGIMTEVNIPIGAWPSGFIPTQITRWNIGGPAAPTGTLTFRMTFDPLSLTGGATPTPPAITAEPPDRAIGVGTGTTMTVVANANNSGTLRYQWKKGGSDIVGATLATLSFSDAALTASGLYQVIVSNDAGPTPSREARLTVLDARPTHILGPGFTGYIAGETITISNTIVHGGASQLRWSVTLPDAAGWAFVSDNATTASTRPSPGTPSLIEWEWTTVPTSPFTFTYTLQVPIGTDGDRFLAGLVQFTQAGISGLILAKPDPLIVRNVLSRHSADTDGDLAISLFELTRVIELYNTRNGTVRTGAYDRATIVTEDGFAAAPTRGEVPTTLTRYHSADFRRDGMIDLFELSRVIELYNTRAGTVRTGRYHRDDTNPEDGFAPGP